VDDAAARIKDVRFVQFAGWRHKGAKSAVSDCLLLQSVKDTVPLVLKGSVLELEKEERTVGNS